MITLSSIHIHQIFLVVKEVQCKRLRRLLRFHTIKLMKIDPIKTYLSFIILLTGIGISIPAFTQSELKVEVLGWGGKNVHVQREQSGEADDEDGVPTEYYLKSIETYDLSHMRKSRFIRSVEGPVPDKLMAKGIKGDPPLLSLPLHSSLSNSEDYLVNFTRSESIKTEEKRFRCEVTEKYRLFDLTTSTVFEISVQKYHGELSRSRRPKCPHAKTDVYWREDDRAFAILLIIENKKLHVQNFLLNTVRKTDTSHAFLQFKNPIYFAVAFKNDKEWKAIIADVEPNLARITRRKDPMGKLAYAFLKTQSDEKKQAQKLIKTLVRRLKKNSIEYGVAAFVLSQASASKESSKLLDKFVRKASIDDIILLANLFYIFDLNLAAQLYVVALSRKDVSAEQKLAGYTMLLRTLLDQGGLSAAKQVLEQADYKHVDFLSQKLRYRILRRDLNARDDVIEFTKKNINYCDAYLLLGRSMLSTQPQDARVQFQTAIFCDPNLGEAIYLLAELEKRSGKRPEANALFKLYRKIAKPRKGDDIRDSRRLYAYEMTHKRQKKKRKKNYKIITD